MNDIAALFKQFIGRPHSEAYAMRLILGGRPPNREWGAEDFSDDVIATIIPHEGRFHHIRLEWDRNRIITSVTYEGAFRV